VHDGHSFDHIGDQPSQQQFDKSVPDSRLVAQASHGQQCVDKFPRCSPIDICGLCWVADTFQVMDHAKEE